MPKSPLKFLLAEKGPQPAASLRRALGISPATLSRLVAHEGSEILRLGKARATRYALYRQADGMPPRLPIYRVDLTGEPMQVAELFPIAPGSWIETIFGGAKAGHLHPGLLPALADMAPSGYLGDRFAETDRELRLPPGLSDWSDDHRLIALARRGEDAPGDLILGTESLDRYLRRRAFPLRPEKRADYPLLAEQSATGGETAWLGGGQPKFSAYRNGHHHLIKFTSGDGSPTELRWRDLLCCESIALSLLDEAGVPAAHAELADIGERRFLEVRRFDRIGERGRRGVLTLGPIADDLVDLFSGRDTWTDAASRLQSAELLAREDARRMRLLEAFGICINNGDRHFGNIAFFADGVSPRPQLLLAPAYDMLPMSLAPKAGMIPPLPTAEPVPQARLLEVWGEAAQLANQFWTRVREDDRISRAFRKAAPGAG